MTLQAGNNVTSLCGASEQLDVCSVGPGSEGARPLLGLLTPGSGADAGLATGGNIPLVPKKKGFTCFWRH